MPHARCPNCHAHSNFRKENQDSKCSECSTNLYDYYLKDKTEDEAATFLTSETKRIKKEIRIDREKQRLEEPVYEDDDDSSWVWTTLRAVAFIIIIYFALFGGGIGKISETISNFFNGIFISKPFDEYTCNDISDSFEGESLKALLRFVE